MIEFITANYYLFLQMVGVLVAAFVLFVVVRFFVRRAMKRLKVEDEKKKTIERSTRWVFYVLTLAALAAVILNHFSSLPTAWLVTTGSVFARTIVVAFVGMLAITMLERVLKGALELSKVDRSIHTFLMSAVKAILYLVLLISCLDLLGINTTSFIAALSALGLALSLSVQDNLSNLIGGIVMMFTKPFVVGDYIEISEVDGKVSEIHLFYTVLHTFDNKKVLIPNNDVVKAKIINHSAEPTRRLDIIFSISYNAVIDNAKEVILKIANESGYVLPDKEYILGVTAQGANSIDLLAGFWVSWEDYYKLRFYMLQRVKEEFDVMGISIPYNQMDIHIVKTDGVL